MIKIKLIIISIICILLVFHLHRFLKRENKLEILQVNDKLESTKIFNYLKENLPIVILNHTKEDILGIMSPLTIKKKFINTKQIFNKYALHQKDGLFIIANNEITVDLIIPNEYKNFSKTNEYNEHVLLLDNNNNDFNFIQIILKPSNILYIPRYWIFNINAKNSLDYKLFINETIFSFIFTFYKIVPFIFNKFRNNK